MTRKEGSGIRTRRSGMSKAGRDSTKPRRDNVAELIRALMDGAKTCEELMEFVTLSQLIVREWLNAFHDAGVVRICERLPGNLPVYELQKSPFALPDAELKDIRPARRASRDSYAQRGVRVTA